MKPLVGCALLVVLTTAHAAAKEHPRAALVVASPPGPLPEELAATRAKLATRYRLLPDVGLRHVLEGFAALPSVEGRVLDALDRARQRMRQLDLPAVGQALIDAEKAASALPPTPSGRALLGRVFVREAALALLNKDQGSARRTMALALSADPALVLDPVDASPPMAQLLASEKARRATARTGTLTVRNPEGPTQIIVEGVSRGVSPAQLQDVHQGWIVVWCVRDGFRSKITLVEMREDASIQVTLDPLDAVTRAAPLVEALRRAEAVSRSDAARALAAAIDVDVILLQGSDARDPLGLVELMRVDPTLAVAASSSGKPATKAWYRKGWVWGVIGTSVAVIAAGTALGVVYGTRSTEVTNGVAFGCCR